MAAEDYIPEGPDFFDDDREEYRDDEEDPFARPGRQPLFSSRPSVPMPRTCNRCGTQNLYWGEYATGWRLFTAKGELHSCSREAAYTINQISIAACAVGIPTSLRHRLFDHLRTIK